MSENPIGYLVAEELNCYEMDCHEHGDRRGFDLADGDHAIALFRNTAVPRGGEVRLFELTDSEDVDAGYYKLGVQERGDNTGVRDLAHSSE